MTAPNEPGQMLQALQALDEALAERAAGDVWGPNPEIYQEMVERHGDVLAPDPEAYQRMDVPDVGYPGFDHEFGDR